MTHPQGLIPTLRAAAQYWEGVRSAPKVVSSLLSSTAGLQQFRYSWRQGLELQYMAPWLSSVSETRFQALGVGENSPYLELRAVLKKDLGPLKP